MSGVGALVQAGGAVVSSVMSAVTAQKFTDNLNTAAGGLKFAGSLATSYIINSADSSEFALYVGAGLVASSLAYGAYKTWWSSPAAQPLSAYGKTCDQGKLNYMYRPGASAECLPTVQIATMCGDDPTSGMRIFGRGGDYLYCADKAQASGDQDFTAQFQEMLRGLRAAEAAATPEEKEATQKALMEINNLARAEIEAEKARGLAAVQNELAKAEGDLKKEAAQGNQIVAAMVKIEQQEAQATDPSVRASLSTQKIELEGAAAKLSAEISKTAGAHEQTTKGLALQSAVKFNEADNKAQKKAVQHSKKVPLVSVHKAKGTVSYYLKGKKTTVHVRKAKAKVVKRRPAAKRVVHRKKAVAKRVVRRRR